MNSNLFFKKKKIKISKIFPNIIFQNNFVIENIKSLSQAKKNDLTFFDSIKYKNDASTSRAGACITTDKLKGHLGKKVQIIVVKSVLFELAKALKQIYPLADIDYPDLTLKNADSKKFKTAVCFFCTILPQANDEILILFTKSILFESR